ncbi:MAG TPA: HDOD domain-containing protein [Acidimicrobiales bacterium]|nr:HDOD domain-containing protein [Acidimicrobiales bacterium]
MTTVQTPISPATVSALLRLTADPDLEEADLAAVVAADAGLAARVLAVANSAAFGLSRQVTQVHQAVGLVGMNLVQTLAIAGSCQLLDGSVGLPHARRHAVEVACAARALAERAGLNGGEAFSAGLLHDLGEILLWRQDPGPYAAAHAGWTDSATQLREERGTYGTDHALVAREQLAGWNVPGNIVDAVGDHHRPDLLHRDLCTAVVAAEELTDRQIEWSPRFEIFGVSPTAAPSLRDAVCEQADELLSLLVR